MTTTVAIRVQL